MKYVSTRGKAGELTCEQVVFTGWASDGGLYVPEHVPEVHWQNWRPLTYPQIVAKLLQVFLSDIHDIDFDRKFLWHCILKLSPIN